MLHKEKSIFNRILVPLIFLVSVQALLMFSVIFVSGTTRKIDMNTVNIMEQTAENRKIIVENSMIQHWSDIGEEVSLLNRSLQSMLKDQDLSMDDFLADKELQQQFLYDAITSESLTIRKNSVNGYFIVFANQEFFHKGASKMTGVYFRDLDSSANPNDNSDILMERGMPSFTHKFRIPFDVNWTSEFYIDSQDPNHDYFNKPFFAFLNHQDMNYSDLGYWSKPFYLNPNNTNDSYEMITYTVPLICNDQVYGVLGIDVSVQTICEMMPSRELGNGSEQSGYLLVSRDTKQDEQPYKKIASTGAASKIFHNENTEFWLGDTKYGGFYNLTNEKINGSQACGTLRQLNLYKTNTPFYDDCWYLMAVGNERDLFSFSNQILSHMAWNTIVSIFLGMIAAYLIATVVTHPIRNLASCIKRSNEKSLEKFEVCHITEIDELYEVLCDLTRRQREAEEALTEEKERYQAALECSNATLFEYDVSDNSIYLYNITDKKNGCVNPRKILTECRESLIHKDYIFNEDKNLLKDFFSNNSDYKNYRYRGRLTDEDEEFRWIELKGKSIYNSNRQLIKIIGSLVDIQDEMLKELEEKERRKHDQLTGLYNRSEGTARVKEDLDRQKKGSLLLLDISHFYKINNSLGIVAGDILLEETGQNITALIGPEDVAFRYGGDEFAVWFAQKDSKAAEDFYHNLTELTMHWNESTSIMLNLDAGYTVMEEGKEKSFYHLMQEAMIAILHAKKRQGANIVSYASLTASEKKCTVKTEDIINEIVGLNYESEISITSLTFNMFDKADEFNQIMPLLLYKIGRYFQLTDIIMLQADKDFYSNYVWYQWHNDNKKTLEGAYHYPEDVYNRCVKAVCSKRMKFQNSTLELTAQQKEFFMISENMSGLCFPIMIDGEYVGSVAFMSSDQTQKWAELAENSLDEIVKIISTNFGKARSDLASKAKSDFLSRMSHEIRTPMNAILGMTAIAKQNSNLPEDIRNCLDQIDSSSHFLLSIINDILDMSRIERGKMELSVDAFDLSSLLQEVELLIKPQMHGKGLKFVIHKEDLKHPVIFGDSMRLNQVIINLLSNALKFTDRGGSVTLTVKQVIYDQERCSVTISVKDTGIGIHPDNKERIFSAFEQEDSSTVTKYGGTGLGLAISNNLVQMMGGKLDLRSQVGKGSEFFFTIPARLSDEVIEKSTLTEDKNWDFSGKRILLVEDNQLNREIAEALLSFHGFQVEKAENGKEAVDLFTAAKSGYYDVILMDIRMPVMDGLEATRNIRNSGHPDARDVPIIAMTASAFDEDMKKSIECGMNGHLAKPIDIKRMNQMLGELIETK